MYSELIAQYPTSESLFAFLKSPAGGNLVIRDNRQNPEDSTVIIHYGDTKVDGFRSVVWNTRTNRPLCAAPPVSKHTVAEDATGFVAEEFIDGVMLNMFWDTGRSAWRLASRSQIDAQNTFYSRRPFAELFDEAVHASSLDLNELSRDYTYSWVLQHPAERIVTLTPYGIPRVRLVQMARFLENGDQLVVKEPTTFLTKAFRDLLPERHELKTGADVTARLAAWGHRFGVQWKGLVLKNDDGSMVTLRTTQYNEAREMRGNSAKLAFVWLERWSAMKLNQYLKIYPEEAHAANTVVESFKQCTQDAFNYYQAIYKRREYPLGKAPQKYRKLLWDIHAAHAGSYFPKLRTFMNEQDTARKLWLVNYEVRYPDAETTSQEVRPAEVTSQEVMTPAEVRSGDIENAEALASVNAAEAADEDDKYDTLAATASAC